MSTTTVFLWASGVVGFFAGIADFVQYFRYRKGFPDSDFTMNLLAGIAAFLMCAFSASSVLRFHKELRRSPLASIAVSSGMAFILAFMPRPLIGSAVSLDLFVYLGGLGSAVLLFLYSSAPSSDLP